MSWEYQIQRTLETGINTLADIYKMKAMYEYAEKAQPTITRAYQTIAFPTLLIIALVVILIVLK